jgi:hypothetical protein
MIDQVTEEVFKNTKGVSYSRLSKLAESPQAYQAALAEEDDSSAMALGSAVDIMLTQPERFEELVYVMSAEKPGSEMMQIFCEVYAETEDKVRAHAASGFKINLDRVMIKFNEEGKEYYEAIIKGKGKKILDIEGMFKANKIVDTLKTNPWTKKYFVPEEGVELLFQPKIIWDLPYHSYVDDKLRTVTAKSMLDVIRIDHANKVIQPIDLKTGAESFMKAYWKYRRYLQGAMYTTATHYALSSDQALIQEYEIENMKFIFADSNLVFPPVIYKMSNVDYDIGIAGLHYTTFANDKMQIITDRWKVKGYSQLAAELEWHEKNNMWDYSYDVYQKKGELDIDAFIVKF